MDDNVRKIRGSLNSMSVAIILYMWAGGTLGTGDGKGKASFFGGSITFDHPEYLEVMALLIFGYLILRYVLHSYDVLRLFGNEFAIYFMCSGRYLNYVMLLAPRIHYLVNGNEQKNYLKGVKENSLKAVRGMILDGSIRIPPIASSIFFPSKITFPNTLTATVGAMNIGLVNDQYGGQTVEVNDIESLKITLLAVYSFFKFFFIWERLYDLVVPYLLAVEAIYFLVTESDKGLGHVLNIVFR